MFFSRKGFTIIEIVIVILIIVILTSFGFSKISNFFLHENTISSMDDINRFVLKNKISSTLNKKKSSIIFNKKSPYFYSVYYFKEGGENKFMVNSGSLVGESKFNVNFYSEELKNLTGTLIIENENDFSEKEISFNSDGVSNDFFFNFQKTECSDFYIKNSTDYIMTGKLKVFDNSKVNNIFISTIIGKTFSSEEIKLDFFEISNFYTGNFKIYTEIDDSLKQLSKVKLSFVDRYNNNGYLEFY